MPMMDPVWTEALEVCEDFADLQRRHRADGRVDEEEAALEASVFQARVFAQVERVHRSLMLAQVVMRRGPESPRARRLARELERSIPQ